MVGLLVLYTIFSHHWMWMVALGIGAAALLSGGMMRLIHTSWFWIAEKIGYVMSRVILGTLFLIVLLPIAFVAKFFRPDFMLLKTNYSSFFVNRLHVYHREDFEKPW